MRRALLMVVLLAACEHEETHTDNDQAKESCLADELAGVHTEWTRPDDCDEQGAGCERACARGKADACYALGLFAEDAQLAGSAEEEKKALQYVEQACRLGVASGCTNWAAHHLHSNRNLLLRRRPPSDACVYRVFQRACDAGEAFGCSMTARMLIDRPRTAFDPWIGYGQLASACDRRDGPPCRFLAYYLELGYFGSTSTARIKSLLERACSGGDENACGKQTADETMLAD